MSTDSSATIVSKVWNYAHVLKNAGVGYGDYVTKKSNDGGIDGIINEDRLGLDVIYIQAKRYQAESTIGRKEIQSFVGALAGKQANKGVFITTSGFKKTATEYASTVIQKVILIDGAKLADLYGKALASRSSGNRNTSCTGHLGNGAVTADGSFDRSLPQIAGGTDGGVRSTLPFPAT